MRWRLLLGAVACLALSAGMAAADVQQIPLPNDESRLAVVDQGPDQLRFRIEIGELSALEVMTREGPFTRLVIPGFHSSKVEGAPELPMMNRLIATPHGATASVEASVISSRTVDLAEYGVTSPLFPAQPSMPKSADPETWPFVYDRAAYRVDRAAQELARVVGQGRLRAMDLGRLEISPVEYYPAENRIRVADVIEVTVSFAGADRAAGEELMTRTASPFFDHLYGTVGGAKAFQDAYPDRVGDVVTMVVVTPPEFEAQLQDFVDWKTERGFHVIVAVTGTPEVGTTTTSIQTYLHGLYNAPPAGLPAPSFVLFVGDVAQMPTFFEGGDATDRPYCAVDGDLVPDMYYGRFSATNSTQLQAILDKTMMYDQYTMPDPGYLDEVVMIAGVDSYWAPTHANGQINYGTTYYFNAAHGITSHTYLYPASGSSDAQIVQDVSDGVAYVNYTAHGSQTSWSDPTFTQTDINSLANSGQYCLAVGNCCLTSSYDYGECMAETWLRAPDKGAIGYIGGSNSTYWDEDFWWGVGYTASITANPTYEATGLGVYDGLFHDHGEAEHLWYVTNDALIFCGNLAVMEAGSSRITYYWNIYNLMGDPSLTTYLGQPAANPVVHPATVFTTALDVTVDADQGSYVGLTQAGVLVGAGTVDASGSLTVDFLQSPLTPGLPLHMVVMAQNREPYVADLDVIVPATVTIDPLAIDANVTTDITVTVMEADGVTPKPDVNVWAEGLDYATTPVATDAGGVAVITVNYAYGPTLDIVGQELGESYRLFTEQVTVNAQPLTAPDLYVTTDIGLTDAFALNLPGVLHAAVGEGGFTLWAELPDGSQLSTAAASLELTPAELGQVTGIIAVSGYDLYSESFDVIEAYGTLTGTVASGGTPLVDVTVRGYDAAMDLVFEAVTDGTGAFDVGEDILVAPYTIQVDFFGFLHYEAPYFVNYGANVLDIELTPAPSGVLSGVVTALDTGDPLAATVRVYRSDTMELYTETSTDPADGSYATDALPYFDYRVTVKAWHYIPVTIDLTIEEPTVLKSFVLEPTIGDLLVIDAAAKGLAPDKYDADGVFLAPGYDPGEAKAAADMQADLEDLGYTVTLETASGSDPLTWENYDLVLVSAGSSTSAFATAFQQAVIDYVLGGGHLLVEGGEVGYAHYSGDFGTYVLHSNDWNHDSSGSVTVADPAHYVMSVPNTITGPITVAYSAYGDHDAMVPNPDAVTVGSWTDYPTDASIICYDPNPAPQGGQIAYYTFNYGAMDAAVRPLLLQNTVTWLMAQELGNCSVSGVATLQGESDHSGILVEAIPNGGSTTTAADGSFTLPGLFAGTYQIVASKAGYRDASAEVTLGDGEQLTGLELMLGAPGSVSGVATLKGETDHSGIRVEAQPGGVFVVTGTDGAYALDGLIAGDYTIRASKSGWAPATAAVTLGDAEHLTDVDLMLMPTAGSLLVIDDSAAVLDREPKFADKGATLLAEGYTAPESKTAAHIAGDLELMGYDVVVEAIGSTDPAGWLGYDLLVWSSGDNATTVNDPAMQMALQDYVAAGGRLLVEGGEIGYDHNGTAFGMQVLHVDDWNHDSSGDVTIHDPSHPVMSAPNALTSPMGLNYVGYGDADALVPTADAQMIGSWTSWPTDASVIVYDDTPAVPTAGQVVLLAFNYSAMATSCAPNLLQNAVVWLLASEGPGDCSIAGACYVSDAPDNGGVTVTAYPGGVSYVTGPDGTYELTDLYAGTYTVTATKPGYGSAPQTVTLAAGEHAVEIDFGLGLITEVELCDAAAIAIPDADPLGVSRTLLVTQAGILADVYCSVDVTHTWRGDLIVTLTSPEGTTVTLHNRTGSMADDLHAVYDLDTAPDGPGGMADFDGEDPVGEWTFTVSDNAAADTGTLDQWCLDLSIAERIIGVSAGPIQAASVTGGVALSWQYDADAADGFHVYRRTADGPAVRLTDAPLAGRDGQSEYLDPGYGLAAGTVLYYSYGMVRGGEEIGRSEEFEVTFAGSAPSRFALHQNWPNPFNPMTNIRFDLPVGGKVSLCVYDVSGRLVRTLVDESLPASVHLYQWDGADDGGRRAASGIYYCRLVTAKNTATSKMLLVK